MTKRKLTPKQQAFADFYIETGNASESALKAGYSEGYAKTHVYKLLENARVKVYIDKRMEEIESKRIMDRVEALELLTEIGRGEMTEEVVVSTPMGAQKVIKTPDIRERQRAITELLKRHMAGVSDELKEELLKVQVEKMKAEVEKLKRESNMTDTDNIVIVDEWGYTDES